MKESKWQSGFNLIFILMGSLFICFPLLYCITTASLNFHDATSVPIPFKWGGHFLSNIQAAWNKTNLGQMMLNSFVMASGITIGKISISLMSAFAMIYFRFPFKKITFWIVFMTLMLPVEVRILPTYEVAANIFSPLQLLFNFFNLTLEWEVSLLDRYTGLVLPLIASATATFLFRQFFMTIPEELTEAAIIDGVRPWQFFVHVVLPLSKTNIAALVVIIFVYGWNQYLWPLLITTDPEMRTAIMGIETLIPKVDEAPEWNVAMAGSLLVMLPPVLVVFLMQKWFVKGLIEQEK